MPVDGGSSPGPYRPGSILITQGELVDYGGSEVVTLELAEHLSRAGWSVQILTAFTAEPLSAEFRDLPGVVVHTDPASVDLTDLDVIWVHHQVLPPSIVELAEKGQLTAKVVFHHMSPFVPREFPMFPAVETWLADAILFNSPETQRSLEGALSSVGLTGRVLGNPAPDSFWRDPAQRPPAAELSRLLVVSNHLSEELQEAVAGLRVNGVEVRVLGLFPGGESRRTEPADLEWADAVVSIGKTVQYGIVHGLPVYCYDRFGGPDWLSGGTIETCAQLNFSGRGFASKDPGTIVREIQGGFAAAQEFARSAHAERAEGLLLSRRWDEVLAALEESHVERGPLDPADKAVYAAIQQQVWDLHRDLRAQWTRSVAYSAALEVHSAIVAGLTAQTAALAAQLNDLQRSRSWRLGAPLRWLAARVRPGANV